MKLFDFSLGEQIVALRRREIDLALIDHGADLLSHDFYVRMVPLSDDAMWEEAMIRFAVLLVACPKACSVPHPK